MVKKRIAKIVNIAGHGVPVDENGYYLDWKRIHGDYAGVLTSPYGPRYFVLGDEEARIVLDFARLPGGKYFITATCEPEELDLHPEDRTIVCDPADAAEAAFHLVSHAVEVLDRIGVACKDPWDFARKICVCVEADLAAGVTP